MGTVLSKLRGKVARVEAVEPREALLTALQRLLTHLSFEADTSDIAPALVAEAAFKIRIFSRTAQALQLDASDVAICLDDTEGTLRAIELTSGSKTRVVNTYLQRLSLDLDRLNDSQGTTTNLPYGHPTTITTIDEELAKVGNAYREDAKEERRLASRSNLMAALLLGGVTASAYWLTVRAISEDHSAGSLAGPALVCVLLAVFSLVLLRRTAGHTRSSREYVRLERGLRAIPLYLATLPPEARHLVRAVMTQTLFPRLLEDDDPERHIEFPDPATILTAIDPSVFAREEEEP